MQSFDGDVIVMVCRDRAALARANRKMDKRLKELQIQAEDERRSADQYKEQVSRSLGCACWYAFFGWMGMKWLKPCILDGAVAGPQPVRVITSPLSRVSGLAESYLVV